MKILWLTNDFPPTIGGIENIIYSVSTRLPRDEVFVLTRQVPGWEEFDGGLDFEVARLPVATMLPTPRLVRRATEFIKSRSIDVVHIPTPLPLGLMGELKKEAGIPMVQSVMGTDFVFTSRLPPLKQLTRRALGNADLILPLSRFLADHARRLVPDGLIRVLPAGVQTNLFHPEASPAELEVNGPVILLVGRMVHRKGAAALVNALPRVFSAHPNATAVLVGGGPKKFVDTLKETVAAAGIENNVIFAGPRNWEQLPGLYAAADIFALPGTERLWGLDTEGFGMVFLEAAAAGLPTVAGNVGGVPDAIVDGETGYLVDGENSKAVADVITRLIDDPDERKRLGDAGRRRVEQEYDWDRIVERYKRHIQELLEGRS